MATWVRPCCFAVKTGDHRLIGWALSSHEVIALPGEQFTTYRNCAIVVLQARGIGTIPRKEALQEARDGSQFIYYGVQDAQRGVA